jgi:mRNA interferase MazF
MGRFIRGEVVVLPFPFSDLTDAKRRPALVLAELQGDDLILCQITSVNRGDLYAISLNTTDFANGSLPRPSFICPNRLFTGDANIIHRSAGHISQHKLQQTIDAIIRILTP